MLEITCPRKLPQEVEHSLKTTQTASLKTHPWQEFTHDFMTQGVYTWFSPLLSRNQVVCFRRASLVCFSDCVGANASEWACVCARSCVCVFNINKNTHCPWECCKQIWTQVTKTPHDFITLIIFHRQLSLLLGIQVITMHAAVERMLKDVFLYGKWFVCFTFQPTSLLCPNLHYSTKTINHWWSDLLILLI